MGKTMSEENIRRMYETIAQIMSEKHGVQITLVGVKKKNEPDKSKNTA
jgi:hypothetical protein